MSSEPSPQRVVFEVVTKGRVLKGDQRLFSGSGDVHPCIGLDFGRKADSFTGDDAILRRIQDPVPGLEARINRCEGRLIEAATILESVFPNETTNADCDRGSYIVGVAKRLVAELAAKETMIAELKRRIASASAYGSKLAWDHIEDSIRSSCAHHGIEIGDKSCPIEQRIMGVVMRQQARIAELEADRDDLRRFRAKLLGRMECPECGRKCAHLTDEPDWICENCKHRWPINPPALTGSERSETCQPH